MKIPKIKMIGLLRRAWEKYREEKGDDGEFTPAEMIEMIGWLAAQVAPELGEWRVVPDAIHKVCYWIASKMGEEVDPVNPPE
jgi:hypothetical protein